MLLLLLFYIFHIVAAPLFPVCQKLLLVASSVVTNTIHQNLRP